MMNFYMYTKAERGEKSVFLNDSDSILFDMLSNSSSRTFFFFSDLRDNTARWSKGAVEFFGLESDILNPALELWTAKIHPDDIEKYLADFQEMVSHHGLTHDCEYRMMNAEGTYVWVNCKGVVKYDENDVPSLFAGFVTNMGDRNKIDPVTNLLTFFEFRNDLDAELQRGNKGAALQLSIVDYKRINDIYSYAFGDAVLAEIANQFRAVISENVSLYRMEGTDFGFIIPNATKEYVEQLYSELISAVQSVAVDGKIVNLRFHSCCIFYPDHGEYVDKLQTRLSYALATAKTKNASSIVYFSDEIYEERNRKIRLKEALKKSVDNDCAGFRMVYQPILDAEGKELIAAEALLRWNSADFEKIGPMEFVPVLEETGLIIDVGRWILEDCIKTIDKWSREYHKSIKVHVNMSLMQFMDEDVLPYIKGLLEKYEVNPGLLVLELTESCRVDYSEELGEKLKEFRAYGIEIALDDFGTGYASLAVLKDVPATIVKLDHTLIRTILDRPKDKKLIEFIIMYCNAIDISVCAEGVENEEIFKLVKNAGAVTLQGYHFDKPLEISDFQAKYFA